MVVYEWELYSSTTRVFPTYVCSTNNRYTSCRSCCCNSLAHVYSFHNNPHRSSCCLENPHQSRAARLGPYHSYLQSDRVTAHGGQTRLVDLLVDYSRRQHSRRYHAHSRIIQEFWQRHRLHLGPLVSASRLLSYSRFWQRSIPGHRRRKCWHDPYEKGLSCIAPFGHRRFLFTG